MKKNVNKVEYLVLHIIITLYFDKQVRQLFVVLSVPSRPDQSSLRTAAGEISSRLADYRSRRSPESSSIKKLLGLEFIKFEVDVNAL